MWQVRATFSLGDYRTSDIDLTPAIGVALVALVLALLIQTGM